ncbi:MAG: hypothetical protein ACLUYV_03880 [Alistipes shahii]
MLRSTLRVAFDGTAPVHRAGSPPKPVASADAPARLAEFGKPSPAAGQHQPAIFVWTDARRGSDHGDDPPGPVSGRPIAPSAVRTRDATSRLYISPATPEVRSTTPPRFRLRDPDNKEKYIGSGRELGRRAESAIMQAATGERPSRRSMELGEAAFYGPKLDFMVGAGRHRPPVAAGTIQVDYNTPGAFRPRRTRALTTVSTARL